MPKPRFLLADYAVYLLVRIFVCVIQGLPPRAALGLAAGLAWLTYRINRRHREVARDNLRQAFPGRYDEAELDEEVRAVYRHFCALLIEIIQIPRHLHAHNWRRHLELVDGPQLIASLLSGRPLLLVTG